MGSTAPIRRRSARAARLHHGLLSDGPVYPFTEQIALLAGRIDGEQRNKGIKIPFQDVPIGATAVHVRYAVVTGNTRHFEVIPDPEVKPL